MASSSRASNVTISTATTDTSFPIYQYRKLRAPTEVRLLKITKTSSRHDASNYRLAQLLGQPAANKDALTYSIEHVDIEHAPDYEAVSYVWGSSHKTHHIQLDDGQLLPVTASVFCALPHLAKVCQTDYLWIDQVTIDQSNIAERNDQVKVMGQIYRRTSRCLVWMDDGQTLDIPYDQELAWDKDAGAEVRRFLQAFSVDASLESPQSPNPESPTQPSSPLQSARRTSQASREYARVREHLLWFLEHPWFRRTWVFQEFLLPEDALFLIRDFQIPLDEIRNVFGPGYPRSAAWFESFKQKLYLDQGREVLFQRAPGLEFLLAAFQSRHVGMSSFLDLQRKKFAYYEVLGFTDILNMMASSQAQHDHDHVYAFLGLAPFLLRHMTVDYTIPTEQAFATTAKALISESRTLDHLDILSSADISKSKLTLPSWVINWTVRFVQTGILCHDNLFMASGKGFGLPSIHKCKHYDQPSARWNELDVAGKIIDTVSFLLTPFSVYQTTPSLEIDPVHTTSCLPWEMSTLSKFMHEMKDFGIPDIGNEGRTALLRTLFMDGVIWAAIDAHESRRSLYRTGQEIINGAHNEKIKDVISVLTDPTKQPDYDDLPNGATLKILHELSKVQYCRRMVYCEGAKFALAMDLVDKGDKIAILHGARVPFVLRPRPDGKFNIVGQCFYDGAMYGELADPEEESAEIFTLV